MGDTFQPGSFIEVIVGNARQVTRISKKIEKFFRRGFTAYPGQGAQ